MKGKFVRAARAAVVLALMVGCTPMDPTIIPVSGQLPLKYTGPSTGPAITAGDLMTRLYIFSDDSMLGRRAGDVGNLKGTAYIEREVRKIGLIPAGENGTYLQDVPLIRRLPAASLRFGGDSLILNTDFVVADPRAVIRRFSGLPVIYAGKVGQPGAELITAEQASGKIVVVTGFPRAVIPMLRSASAILYVDDANFGVMRRGGRGGVMIRPRVDTTTAAAPFVIPVATATKIFGVPFENVRPGTMGQVLTGSLSFTEIPLPGRNVVAVLPGSDPVVKGQYVVLGAHNDHIGIRAGGSLEHDSVRAYNKAVERIVIDRTGLVPSLPGRPGSAEQAQWLAGIKVNVDSLRALRPGRLDSVYNGADDDGSGSVGLLELAEYFASLPVKPKRSILFVWHTGEEAGLLGSRWFTDNPTVPLDSVVGAVNMDMVGRGAGSERGKSDRYVSLLGSRRISKEMGDIVDAINTKPQHKLEFDYQFDAPGHPERFYCRSDHWNYARMGVPVTFLSGGNHVDYHQLTDEAQYIDYPQFTRVILLAEDIVQTIANLDHRLVRDKPKPAPDTPCVQ
ncbi:MAG: M28 family peptidase [Gemmatimonadaceae bacterium]|nr:M28 family peptidase [Gemmatimonadaceae bacterium]